MYYKKGIEANTLNHRWHKLRHIIYLYFFCEYMFIKLLSQTYSQVKGGHFCSENCPDGGSWLFLSYCSHTIIKLLHNGGAPNQFICWN